MFNVLQSKKVQRILGHIIPYIGKVDRTQLTLAAEFNSPCHLDWLKARRSPRQESP